MASIIKYLTLTLTLFLFFLTSKAQMVTRLDGYGGQPNITPQKYIEVKGDPFYMPNWETAIVYASNNTQYDDVLLKYDMVTDELQFHVPEIDQSFVLDMAVDSFQFVGQGSETHFVKLSDGRYYERLIGGTTSLYKRVNKNIVESQPYSSADKVRTVISKTQYYYGKDDKLERLNTNRRSVLRIVDESRKKDFENFVKSSSINFSSEEGLIKAFEFLNR